MWLPGFISDSSYAIAFDRPAIQHVAVPGEITTLSLCAAIQLKAVSCILGPNEEIKSISYFFKKICTISLLP